MSAADARFQVNIQREVLGFELEGGGAIDIEIGIGIERRRKRLVATTATIGHDSDTDSDLEMGASPKHRRSARFWILFFESLFLGYWIFARNGA